MCVFGPERGLSWWLFHENLRRMFILLLLFFLVCLLYFFFIEMWSTCISFRYTTYDFIFVYIYCKMNTTKSLVAFSERSILKLFKLIVLFRSAIASWFSLLLIYQLLTGDVDVSNYNSGYVCSFSSISFWSFILMLYC